MPWQPGCRITKDRRTVLLQRDQVLQRIHPSLETGGDQAGEHTGDGRVSNVDINGKNTLPIKVIRVVISTFETRP